MTALSPRDAQPCAQPGQPDAPEVSRTDRSDERGQGMIEYAFILVLIAIVLIIALEVLGGQTGNMFSNIANSVGTASGHH